MLLNTQQCRHITITILIVPNFEFDSETGIEPMTFRDPFHLKLFWFCEGKLNTHGNTFFFFLDLFIIIVFIPQYCPLLMFILLDYLHRKTARLCYMTVLILLQMKEGNNWRMFLFSDIQICTAGRISRFMAENVKWSIPLPGQFGEHIYI